MYNITIGRFAEDPEAQGVIRPETGAWQLVIDKNGYPHLYVRVQLEDAGNGQPGTGLLCLEDLLPHPTTIPSLMQARFGGQASPDDETEAMAEALERRAQGDIPCPR